jgi:hypothetical protein
MVKYISLSASAIIIAAAILFSLVLQAESISDVDQANAIVNCINGQSNSCKKLQKSAASIATTVLSSLALNITSEIKSSLTDLKSKLESSSNQLKDTILNNLFGGSYNLSSLAGLINVLFPNGIISVLDNTDPSTYISSLVYITGIYLTVI